MRLRILKTLLYVIFIFCLVSCNENEDYARDEITELKLKISNLQTELSSLQFENSWRESATLYAGETKYTLVEADVGTFATAMRSVQPYANGVRVRISMGNLTAAHINELSFVANYGSVDDKGLPQFSSAKEKEVTFDRQIKSGSWNDTVIELPNISPEKFGYVQLKNIRHKGMSLLSR